MTSGVVLINVVDYVFLFLYLALLVRVVLSWVPGALDSSAGYAIYRITNPILNPLRRLIPPVGGLDLSRSSPSSCWVPSSGSSARS